MQTKKGCISSSRPASGRQTRIEASVELESECERVRESARECERVREGPPSHITHHTSHITHQQPRHHAITPSRSHDAMPLRRRGAPRLLVCGGSAFGGERERPFHLLTAQGRHRRSIVPSQPLSSYHPLLLSSSPPLSPSQRVHPLLLSSSLSLPARPSSPPLILSQLASFELERERERR